ncbi:enoyl-CoA hydratase/isomerase family protein [Nocardioides sp. R-C-SC26]|uniref:enoyl-CoA hydratase/isomerase family protein n=1 Tax=Nocardioides sp. R-C-SC26 TaxID=2870414 RepID=UPI001E658AAC|nr:enoyl-CoA hydratase-related protein [Nocardioides sp. R-C-SC26]
MSASGAGPLRVERRGAVAEVVLARPDQGNALDRALKSALVETLADVGADDSVRAVLVAADGASFCVGQDLRDLVRSLEEDPASAADTVEQHFNPITAALATMPKPVVAAVHGACVGAGLGFALACDLQVWGSGVTLGTAFTRVGLTCDSGLSRSLAEAVGAMRARRLVLTAETFTVEQAIDWGFAGDVVAPDEVLATARDLVDRLATGPTHAYAESKRLLAVAGTMPLAEVLAAEASAQRRCGATADHLESVRAFLERRPPVLTGT